jgi:hypothetical protein
MAVSELLNTLHGELSANAKVLVDPTNDEFKVALQRWSDTDKKVPGAIVLVASEEDIVKIVSRTPPSRITIHILTPPGEPRHQIRRSICSQIRGP